MPSVAKYIDGLASRGVYHFTTEEARTALGGSLPAVRASIRRLKRLGEIADPYRGFHVIVPPEYRRLGCLPPEQFVPQLMEHLRQRYYVALLSAAELHGAAHHRPQSFQVMVENVAKGRRFIACGAVRVEFIARHALSQTPTVEKHTPRGQLRVSSPEATALELVGYAKRAGGLDNVAAVLNDLVEAIDGAKLAHAARLCPIVWVQRLGYLLDTLDQRSISDALVPHVQEHAAAVAPLVRKKSTAGAPRIGRWKLAVNVHLEPDR